MQRNVSFCAQVPSIQDHTTTLVQVYERIIKSKARGGPKSLQRLPAPWRITFDTNPDDCNFACVMCEEHSGFSTKQAQRKEAKQRRRRMDIALIEQTVKECAPEGTREIVSTLMA
ncbi:hypothetical protein CYMTET_3171 [Cymbomonas tetramitiformis]|uniref:Uncharacterized protein n=1 Tax=Cymbomonas tetramitiformis TaxID=36881 RepID=A0AAE0H3V1_9CHLO|nr:hypothetical protein CYMTET_3171 [Cymbomonas tetramitiformis]